MNEPAFPQTILCQMVDLNLNDVFPTAMALRNVRAELVGFHSSRVRDENKEKTIDERPLTARPIVCGSQRRLLFPTDNSPFLIRKV
jgi:hypothetical protein